MDMHRDRLYHEIIETGRKLYRLGFIVATEGNISVRVNRHEIITTRSGVCKGELDPKDFTHIDPKGVLLNNGPAPSTEIKLHLKIYQDRPDINCIIHAHPPYAISMTLTESLLSKAYLPESVILLGAVPIVPYARPSTEEVPRSISGYIKHTDILILERHGTVTIGKSLTEAFQKLEILEKTVKILSLAKQTGKLSELSQEEIQNLMILRDEVYGLDYPILPFE
ncbi:MAG: class II aldolase/adducin family protein [bacterium]|nr:MAG: class II aldolase/adducin family protein [bacterium]